MRTIISTGLGRLHLIQTAERLACAGIETKLICGWVPRNADSWLVKLASRIVGRNLSAGMRKRLVNAPGLKVCTCFFAEAVAQIIQRISRHVRWIGKVTDNADWAVFGFQSRMYIRDADIFHVRSGAGHGGAIRKARRMGMKIVVDHSIAHPNYMDKFLRPEYERNGVEFEFGMDRPIWRTVVEDCEAADVVVVNSNFVKDTFVQEGFSADKIRVVYLGEREDFMGIRTPGVRTGALRLLFTGGFVFRKGAEYVLEALKILKERGVDFKMDVVGSFGQSHALIERYQKYNLPIVFHGPLPQDDLKTFLANGDVYVFPSLCEGCAQSAMEAMAAGLCVIATHESGLPITDGEDGYVVKTCDARAIADRIEWLAANREAIDRVGGRAAKLIAENYTWGKYAANMKQVYVELLSQG